jgi:hypothetical protein
MEMQKTKYNKEYYQAHPELKEKARERERRKRAQAGAFRSAKFAKSKSTSAPQLTSRCSMQIEALLLPIILAVITFLLLREMVEFYYNPQSSQILPWVKALAVEGVILIFSFISDSRAFMRVMYKSLAVALCLFSIYAMSSKYFSAAIMSVNSYQVTERAIVDLETAIKEKRVQRDGFFSKGWISAARKTEASIDLLREKLEVLRTQVVNTSPVVATASATLAQIIFRVLLMFTNILAAHRFGQILKFLETFKNDDEILPESLEISKRRMKFQKSEKGRRVQEDDQFQISFLQPWKISSG